MFTKDRMQKLQQEKEQENIIQNTATNKLYIQQHLDQLETIFSDHLKIEDSDQLNKMILTIVPDDGIWKNHPHEFEINIPKEYPNKPPKIICKTRIWHPNIDENGLVCLRVLSVDFNPRLGLNYIFYGLLLLFNELLSPNDPLNHEAAKQFIEQPQEFLRKANNYMNSIYD